MMIVDLERNDLSRVCEPGSVHWPELMAERAARRRRPPRLDGRGEQLRENVGFAELIEAVFPGGSVTGAPRSRLSTASPRSSRSGALARRLGALGASTRTETSTSR
jgi:para-aminobenzoate synthetase